MKFRTLSFNLTPIRTLSINVCTCWSLTVNAFVRISTRLLFECSLFLSHIGMYVTFKNLAESCYFMSQVIVRVHPLDGFVANFNFENGLVVLETVYLLICHLRQFCRYKCHPYIVHENSTLSFFFCFIVQCLAFFTLRDCETLFALLTEDVL